MNPYCGLHSPNHRAAEDAEVSQRAPALERNSWKPCKCCLLFSPKVTLGQTSGPNQRRFPNKICVYRRSSAVGPRALLSAGRFGHSIGENCGQNFALAFLEGAAQISQGVLDLTKKLSQPCCGLHSGFGLRRMSIAVYPRLAWVLAFAK